MKRELRIQLNNLSKLLFGTASKWQKMVNQGEVATLTRKLEDGTEEKYKGISYYTVDEIKKHMEELWAEELAAQEENKKAAEESAKTIEAKVGEVNVGTETTPNT